MKKKELYNIVLKAIKEIDPKKGTQNCSNCLSRKIQEALKNTDINYGYYNGSDCSNPLFYLEDLGIIEILSGIFSRNAGVDCEKLKIKVCNNPFKYNKI